MVAKARRIVLNVQAQGKTDGFTVEDFAAACTLEGILDPRTHERWLQTLTTFGYLAERPPGLYHLTKDGTRLARPEEPAAIVGA